uniref:Mitochondrial Carrier (MC) Family putative n=1 Tax=Albugo laibachii Nc14 TaxID=890382 RepID=F0W1W4_9STRA|nr:Mitochondrial Carrier (MC) Family putative [Albugo laibachii Nc14]|eukprot:CCA15043.1 Mitochondrial Carrier (MC) Family putative [Albugo laibachii Nc14]
MECDQTLKKALAASAGAMISSFFVTPLDVAKVRLQSQIGFASSKPYRPHGTTDLLEQCRCVCKKKTARRAGLTSLFTKFHFTACCRRSSCTICAPASVQFNGTFHALRYIAWTEGIRGLFSGLSPTILNSIPSTVMYYISYDFLHSEGMQRFPQLQTAMPFLAGASSRVFAASITSPIEMIRTRMQSSTGKDNMMQAFENVIRKEGVGSIFKGLQATLARDVPFSAIYWSCYETSQNRLDHVFERYTVSRVERAFVCGAVAGMLAAACTTPFDVVKTLQQVENAPKNASSRRILEHIVKNHGWRGAFSGLTARLARVAPSCAIMISTYELSKEKLGV